MSKELIFTLNEESRSKVSKVGRKESIFRESYAQAYDVLNTICENTKRHTEENNRLSANSCGYAMGDDLYNFYNNMIVFSARRGCGKTSAMLTFSGSLNEPLEIGEGDDPDLIEKHNQCVKDRKFIVLPPIDPATLDEQHDILSVILSRIFSYASLTWDGLCHRNELLAKKENVIRYLRDCYSGVASLSNDAGKNKEWTLEELSHLSDSAILRKNMYQLMKSVIELRGYEPATTQIVIQIDDADMNFACMFDILEKIRNYMIIPNVTILFAADIDLMWRIIYKKYLSTLTSDGKNSLADDAKSAVELAEQYMLKCFPLKHRIHLKTLSDVLRQHQDCVYLKIIGADREKVLRECYAITAWEWDLATEKEQLPPHTRRFQLEYSLLRCIFRRTGIYFKQYENYHYILPQTQRGFVHFIAMLGNMVTVEHLDQLDSYHVGQQLKDGTVPYLYYMDPKYDAKKKISEIENWLHNVNVFYDYFMGDWLQANLSAEEQDIIRELAALRMVEKNRYIILKVCERLELDEEELDELELDEPGWDEEEKPPKYTFILLRELLKQIPEKLGGLFSFAVRTYYALLTQIMILSDMKKFYEDKAWTGEDMKEPNSFDQLYVLYQSGFLPMHRVKEENGEKYVNLTYEKETHFTLKWEIARKGSETQKNESQEPELQDPKSQEPELQDPKSQEPELQNPKSQEPELQDPKSQESKAQTFSSLEYRHRELMPRDSDTLYPESREPEPQELESQDPVSDDAKIVRRLLTDVDGLNYNILAPLVNGLLWRENEVHTNEEYVNSYRRFQDVCLSILASVDSQTNITRMIESDNRVGQVKASGGRYTCIKAIYEHMLRETWFINEIQPAEDSRITGWLQIGENLLKKIKEESGREQSFDDESSSNAYGVATKSIENAKTDIFGSI